MLKGRRLWFWFGLIAGVVCLDQLSKQWLLSQFGLAEPYRVFPFLNFTLSYNTGAAFSFLGDAGGWQVYLLAVLAAVVVVVLLVWLCRLKAGDTLLAVSLSLIIGGALGNLIDRLRLSYVIDFIDFHIKGWHYATFNLADSSVCVGAFLLVLHMILSGRR